MTQGLTLACRALRRDGARRIAIEDPCFAPHREAIAMTGLEPVPVAVDERGLDVAALDRPRRRRRARRRSALLSDRRDARHRPAPRPRRLGAPPRRPDHRGRLRRRVPLRPGADRRAAGARPRARRLPRLRLEDRQPGAAARLGRDAARAGRRAGAREAPRRHGVGPARADRVRALRRPRRLRPLPAARPPALPRPPRRHHRGPRRADAGGPPPGRGRRAAPARDPARRRRRARAGGAARRTAACSSRRPPGTGPTPRRRRRRWCSATAR